MDMMMPVMDGVETTRRIMASTPCAILIVTGSVRVNASRVFEAMGHGALDAVDTPLPGSGTIEEVARPLLSKIATISRLVGDQARPATAAQRRRSPFAARIATIGCSRSAPPPAAPPCWPRSCTISPKTFPRRWSSCNTWMNSSPPAWPRG